MKRFAFINVPSQELERPPAAAAAISACVRSAGWECNVYDFNLFLHSNVNTEEWIELEQYWRCKKFNLEPATQNTLDEVINKFLDSIVEFNPDMVGLSVFTRFSVISASVMLKHVRSRMKSKIVIGGLGAYAWPGSLPNLAEHPLALDATTFSDYALKTGLVDYYIQGEGEYAIIELLNGNIEYSGINGKPAEQIRKLDKVPHPEYHGIDPSNYYYTSEPGIYITASRGCVRNCKFCSISDMWPKYTNRSASDIVEEIVNGKKKYNVNLFHFTDSLINGNMKMWREVNRQLVEAKQQDPSLQPIKYLGQFICRTRFDQTEKDWELMAKAGCDMLVTGFESYSPAVRKHMGKNHSNADIDFHFAQSAYHGIKNVCLMFVGYPTETLRDHEYNIEFLHRYQKYARAGVIHMVRWGYTGMFREEGKMIGDSDVKLITDPDFAKRFHNLPQGLRDIALGFGWVNQNNPTLTLKERIRRRLELHEVSVKLGWPQTRNREELQILYNILQNLDQNIIDAQDFENLETLLDFH